MGIDRSGVGGRESRERQEEWGGRGREWGQTEVGWEGERVGINRSERGGGSVERQEWEGRRTVGTDRGGGGGVGVGESGDRQEEGRGGM